MKNSKTPHLLFRRLLDILDEFRRESIKAINAPSKKKLYGLTVRQGSAISQLRLMLEDEPMGIALKDLASRMQMTVPATSIMVDALVTRGYMERTPNPNDRRAVCIKLTDKGNELFNDIYARFHDEIDRRAEVLTEEELEAFSRIVEKLVH
ncbi:MAG: MarR family transcriptional regulator [Akkermansia sp.]|nr:MarR family transcriptional regulator [Akkermansia sp.]